MNGIGLAIVLAIGVLVGIVFGVFPQLDVELSALFYDPVLRLWWVEGVAWVPWVRDGASYLVALIAAPAVIAVVGKLLLPRRRMLIPGRAALFLLTTLALGPGILANTILKDHWGRSRPFYITDLGGADYFTAWWDPRGECSNNCSFIAGEPSGAFWTLAPAVLMPPQWRPLAYGAAIAFGAGVGLLRMAGAGHFFTDVVFAGVFMFTLIWVFHGLIYRWRTTRLTDAVVERLLAWPGEALRPAFAALAQRISRQGNPGSN
jgi:membrane-associated PAP2 superfamily phosphatase